MERSNSSRKKPESDLSGRMKVRKVNVENVFLDPNNLRLSSPSRPPVDETRITDHEVQDNVFNEMMGKFKVDIDKIKKSIALVGFLPMDRLVVRMIGSLKDKYVVVEGNERLCAIRSVIAEVNSGFHDEMSKENRDSLYEFDVMLLTGNRDQLLKDRKTIQGIRHFSGLSEWGPFQRAAVIMSLLDEGKTPVEAGEILGGVKPREVIRYKRAYHAFYQMYNDEEYGQFEGTDLFSFFEETVKHDTLSTWLGWNENKLMFLNGENRNLFYSWLSEDEELNKEKGVRRKISEIRDIRKLVEILNDPEALLHLKEPLNTVESAYRIVEAKKVIPVEWRSELEWFRKFVENEIKLEDYTQQDVTLFEETIKALTTKLDLIKRLLGKK